MPIEPPNPLNAARRLAAEHDAPTLAAALAVRLLADGRAELVTALRALLDGAAIDPTPPDPRRAEDASASLNPNPPSPHREGEPSE